MARKNNSSATKINMHRAISDSKVSHIRISHNNFQHSHALPSGIMRKTADELSNKIMDGNAACGRRRRVTECVGGGGVGYVEGEGKVCGCDRVEVCDK